MLLTDHGFYKGKHFGGFFCTGIIGIFLFNSQGTVFGGAVSKLRQAEGGYFQVFNFSDGFETIRFNYPRDFGDFGFGYGAGFKLGLRDQVKFSYFRDVLD